MSIDEATLRRKTLAAHDPWNQRAVLAAFSVFGVPVSFLDIGSGSGIVTRTAAQLCSFAHGIDLIAPENDPLFTRADLCERIFVCDPVEMVWSIETAEHIEESYANRVCENIAKHCMVGGMVVFSAALPGQGGDNHVTLKPPS